MILYEAPFSTNCERVHMALGHKGVAVERVVIDYADRSLVQRVSGQPLVPVLVDDDGTVVADSMRIVRHLEERFPEPALYPADPAALAQMLVFIDWFNRVWKVAPNAIEAGTDVDRHAAEMAGALELFEGLLTGRPYMLGETFSAADCAAYPFLKFALHRDPADDEEFHVILDRYQQLGETHPNLTEWITLCADYRRS